MVDEMLFDGQLFRLENSFLVSFFSLLIIVMPILLLGVSIYMWFTKKLTTMLLKALSFVPILEIILLLLYLYWGLGQDYPQ